MGLEADMILCEVPDREECKLEQRWGDDGLLIGKEILLRRVKMENKWEGLWIQ